MLTFEELLKPLSLKEFVATSWDKGSLHIPGTPGKLAALPGLAEFGKFFAGNLTAERWEPSAMESGVIATWTDITGTFRRIIVPPAQAADLYNAGASLCFQPLDAAHPSLQAFVADVLQHTGFQGEVVTTAYLTPPKSGSDLHFDSQHVFFCQVSGEKHWRISKEPGFKWPPVNLLASQLEGDETLAAMHGLGWPLERPENVPFEEILLKEGDVLYMPPGVWHEPVTKDTHSLHYTLTLSGISTWNLLFAFMRSVMMKHPEWRRDLRFLQSGAPTGEGEVDVVARALATLKEEVQGLQPADLLGLYRSTEALPNGFRRLFRNM